MPSIDFIKDIQENDRKTFFKDFENSKKFSEKCSEEEVPNKSSDSRHLIAGFHRVFSPSQWSFSLHENCKGKNS